MPEEGLPWVYLSIFRKHSNKMRGLWGVILFRKFPNTSNTISGKLLDRSKKSLPLELAAEKCH